MSRSKPRPVVPPPRRRAARRDSGTGGARGWSASELLARPASVGAADTQRARSPATASAPPDRARPVRVANGRPAPEPAELSVVLCTTRPAPARRSLSSVANAAGERDVQTVVVDNGTPPGAILRLTEDFPEVGVLRLETDHGRAWGLDVGMQHTHGRAVLLLEPGVLATPTLIDGLLGHLARQPRCGLVAAQVVDDQARLLVGPRRALELSAVLCDDSLLGRLWPRNRWRQRHHMAGELIRPNAAGILRRVPEPTLDVGAAPLGATLIRREALDEVGGFDPHFAEHGFLADWCARARDAGWRVDVLGEPSATRVDDAPNPTLASALGRHRDRIRYARRHLGPAGARAAKAALWSWAVAEAWLSLFGRRPDGEGRWSRAARALAGAARTRREA